MRYPKEKVGILTSSNKGMFDSLRSVLDPDLESDIIFRRHVFRTKAGRGIAGLEDASRWPGI